MRAPSLPSPSAMALLAFAATAAADDSNFRPYLVGGRAAGMGGAFTALSDDGSGAFYNPGGLAFVTRSQISLSGSVYGIVSGRFRDALGDGHDFTFGDLNTFPTATAGVWKLGDPAADDAQVIGLGVFVPDGLSIDDRDRLVSQENAFFFTNQVQTIWCGLTYARRLGRVGVGATLFGLFGTRLQTFDLTLVDPADPSRFATITGRSDETIYGGVAAIGLRWDATDALHLGASLYSPSFGTGSRRLFVRLTAGANLSNPGDPSGAAIVNSDGLHASPGEPLRAQVGAAWTSGPLTLAADVVWLASRTTISDADLSDQGLDQHVVRNSVLAVSLGAEYVAADRFPLRVGFFTDPASSPSPGDGSIENSGHVDRVGFTGSIGFRSEHTATDLGVNLSFGSGRDFVPDNLDFSREKASGASQRLFYVFLGTSYQF